MPWQTTAIPIPGTSPGNSGGCVATNNDNAIDTIPVRYSIFDNAHNFIYISIVRLSFSLINTVHHCRLLYSIHFNCSAMNDSISRKHHTNTEYF